MKSRKELSDSTRKEPPSEIEIELPNEPSSNIVPSELKGQTVNFTYELSGKNEIDVYVNGDLIEEELFKEYALGFFPGYNM